MTYVNSQLELRRKALELRGLNRTWTISCQYKQAQCRRKSRDCFLLKFLKHLLQILDIENMLKLHQRMQVKAAMNAINSNSFWRRWKPRCNNTLPAFTLLHAQISFRVRCPPSITTASPRDCDVTFLPGYRLGGWHALHVDFPTSPKTGSSVYPLLCSTHTYTSPMSHEAHGEVCKKRKVHPTFLFHFKQF